MLTLTGPGTAADFESVSDQVVYTNSDPNPSTDPRIITVVANDGTSDSNIATAIVHFAGDQRPAVTVRGAGGFLHRERGGGGWSRRMSRSPIPTIRH